MADPDAILSTLKKVALLPVRAVQDYGEDDGPSLAASISFFALLSLAPLLLVVLELAGLLLGSEAAVVQIRDWVGPLVTGEAQEALDSLLDRLSQQKLLEGQGIMGWVGGLVTLFVSTTLVAQVQNGLNRIWRVRPDPQRRDWVVFLIRRGTSLAIILATGVLVIASALVRTALEVVFTWADPLLGWLPGGASWGWLAPIITGVLLAGILTLAFKLLPDARIRWRDALVGGAVTAVLVQVGTWLLGLYLGVAAVGSAWGASGTVAVFLVWIFYTANILLLGAELTRCWALCFGGGVRPGRGAVLVRVETVAEERGEETGGRYEDDPPDGSGGAEAAEDAESPEARQAG
jgi:membrane protein